jgi:hypothetical protein
MKLAAGVPASGEGVGTNLKKKLRPKKMKARPRRRATMQGSFFIAKKG